MREQVSGCDPKKHNGKNHRCATRGPEMKPPRIALVDGDHFNLVWISWDEPDALALF